MSDTASVTVETLPVVDTVSISPTNPTVTDTVTCSATASDADGDTPTLSYAWTDGSTSLGTSASLDLNTSGLAKGNAVACEVTATDNQDTDTQSDTVVITNSVPTVSSVAISPTSPTVNDTLTCSYTFSDDDSDADASTIAWTVGSTTIRTGSTLAAGSASKNEAVSCTVTPKRRQHGNRRQRHRDRHQHRPRGQRREHQSHEPHRERCPDLQLQLC